MGSAVRTGHIMEIFLIVGAIAGIWLGTRFKVFVLLPAILVTAGIVIASGHSLLTWLGTVALLQIGYLVGCVLRVDARGFLRTQTMRHQVRRSESRPS
jgi:hypothetical protein